jgi:hypothetical protein
VFAELPPSSQRSPVLRFRPLCSPTTQNTSHRIGTGIPDELSTLKVSEIQRNQIKEIVGKYDRTIDSV